MDATIASGLTAREAAARLRAHGPNELPATERDGVMAVVAEVAREPMLLMLVVAGLLYVLIGEPLDATMLMASVVVIVGITIVQERRTERALDALRDLANPMARVVRDGTVARVPSREVVVGDVILVGEGDRVPADADLLEATNLAIDESLLTGESVPAAKRAAPVDAHRERAPSADPEAAILSGTLVTAGHGAGVVTATGARSTLGRIGRDLAAIDAEPTALQRETGRVVRISAAIGIAACLVVAGWYAATRGANLDSTRDGILAGIAMAMGILPEEFPVVVTVFMALGAWRISRSRVLTRRMPAIEALGAATVLCVDKTGTLTRNRMAARWLVAGEDALDLGAAPGGEVAEPLHVLLEHAILASSPDGFDPMDRALLEAGEAILSGTEHVHPKWSLAHQYPITGDRLAVVHAWVPASTTGRRVRGAVVVAKGAVEATVGLCHLPDREAEEVLARADGMAASGARVLGVARGRAPAGTMPADPHDLEYEFLGLVGFEDPIRPEVRASVRECQAAGIRVVMITGDHATTARSVAAQAGIAVAGEVMTGAELATLGDAALAARVASVPAFARVVPEQKLRIVRALQARGEVVAMTGDGVNDAPALKAAQIGIAMGGRGTDVAREAADLVLMDDDFSSIVGAIRLGRRIHDNIRKAIAFVFAVHVPVIGLSMIPVLAGDWPLLLLPLHIVFLELVIDPSCALVFEAEEGDAGAMRRPPRDPGAPLFARPVVGIAVAQGLALLAACLWAFGQARAAGATDGAARALVFACLVTGILGAIMTNRSWSEPIHRSFARPNAWFRWVVGAAATLLALSLATQGGRRLLHFDPVGAADVAVAMAWPVAIAAAFEASKLSPRVRRMLSAAA